MMLPVFLVCTFLLASTEGFDDDGKFGKYSTWRETMCTHNNEDMYKDLNVCHDMEKENLKEAVKKCFLEVHPDSEGKLMEFRKAACKEPSIFHKFDECLEKLIPDLEKQQKDGPPEVMACYGDVLTKYELFDLLAYLKKFIES